MPEKRKNLFGCYNLNMRLDEPIVVFIVSKIAVVFPLSIVIASKSFSQSIENSF